MPRTRLAALTAASAASAACLVSLAVAPSATGTPVSSTVTGHTFIPAPGRFRPHPAGDTAGGTAANQQSENWAGYIASGSSGSYSSTSATWTVPTVSTSTDGYSSTWVGIDGATSSDQYLIQTGTEADVVDNQASYDAWWEVITPSDEAPETVFSNLSVTPGDSITASVSQGSASEWTMTLTDNTTGQSASHTSSYSGPGETAEWIQEDTDVNGEISPAPDWHQVDFSGVTTDGSAEDLNDDQAVDIYDSNGTQETSTSAPDATGDGFTVTWLASGTATPTD